MLLLDTNVISELRKSASGKADLNVVEWARQQSTSNLFISVISIAELERGIQLKERMDRYQGQILRRWFNDHVLPTFENRILPITTEIAIRSAQFHCPNPKPLGDTLIATTAIVHGMQIVTRNVSDFDACGVRIINPWETN